MGLSHLRGPTDILAALLGTAGFFAAFYDAPATIARLADQAAQVWRHVARAQVGRYLGHKAFEYVYIAVGAAGFINGMGTVEQVRETAGAAREVLGLS